MSNKKLDCKDRTVYDIRTETIYFRSQEERTTYIFIESPRRALWADEPSAVALELEVPGLEVPVEGPPVSKVSLPDPSVTEQLSV